MSTAHHFADVLPRIQLDPIGMEPDGASSDSWIALRDELGVGDSRRGYFANVIDGADLTSLRRASIPIKSIGRVSLETVIMTLTWEADVRKFHDIDRVSHELGLMSVNTFAGCLSSFRDMFSEIGNRKEVPVSMPILTRGRRVNVII